MVSQYEIMVSYSKKKKKIGLLSTLYTTSRTYFHKKFQINIRRRSWYSSTYLYTRNNWDETSKSIRSDCLQKYVHTYRLKTIPPFQPASFHITTSTTLFETVISNLNPTCPHPHAQTPLSSLIFRQYPKPPIRLYQPPAALPKIEKEKKFNPQKGFSGALTSEKMPSGRVGRGPKLTYTHFSRQKGASTAGGRMKRVRAGRWVAERERRICRGQSIAWIFNARTFGIDFLDFYVSANKIVKAAARRLRRFFFIHPLPPPRLSTPSSAGGGGGGNITLYYGPRRFLRVGGNSGRYKKINYTLSLSLSCPRARKSPRNSPRRARALFISASLRARV